MGDSVLSKQGRVQDPERLEGIPLLSSFIASDEDAAIFRGFTRLGARNLLHLQNHLNELETKLDDLDKHDVSEAPGNLSLRRGAKAYDTLRDGALEYEAWVRREPEGQRGMLSPEMEFPKACYERVRLHQEISSVLHQYRQALIDEQQIQSLSKPSRSALSIFKEY
ncbi:hypothetical protein N0V90_010862 [Kalmusia sp. IMI 367209]|nr:hypothetical protein N0V90_010862 [Kalmusia sp. IMI 367209]